MQEVISKIAKIEQPICHNKLSNEEIIKKIIHEMEICKNSAHFLRNFALQHRSRLNVDDQEFQTLLDHHSLVVLNNIVSSLSMIKSCDFEGCFVKKRKMSSTLEYEKGNISDDHDINGDIIIPNKKCPITKNRRGCYKRRRFGQSRIMEVTKLSDDGFAWRKYGQKQILNAKHPRNYYRCTHKYDQNCQAIKQVQRISENPTKYMIMYYGNHTCNIDDDDNMLKPCPIVIVDNHSSDIFVSFESSNRANNNPSAAAGSGVMQDVYDDDDSMKPEMSSTVSNESYGVLNQNSPLCSDLTATTGQSSSSVFAFDQSGEIVLAVDEENNHYSDNVVADYSYIMADCSELLDWLF